MEQQTGDRAFESSFSQLVHCSFVNVEGVPQRESETCCKPVPKALLDPLAQFSPLQLSDCQGNWYRRLTAHFRSRWLLLLQSQRRSSGNQQLQAVCLEQLTTSLGPMRLTSHFCVQRDTLQCKVISCIENVPLFVTATLLPLQVCRVLSWALCFKEQAKVLWVFLAWCLQPLAASSVWHSHPSEH